MQHVMIMPPGGARSAAQAFVVPDIREAIEFAVEALIARLDEMDGDPDIEANGDETDFTGAEDDFLPEWYGAGLVGAGCPIADPGGGDVDDEGEGIDDDSEPGSNLKPVYGIDQTQPPTNFDALYREQILAARRQTTR